MSTTISKFDLDNLYNWEEIHTTYDDNGVIQDKTKLLDSGVSIEEAFTNGIRHSMFQEDHSSDGSAVSWQSIDSNYDASGQLETRTTLYDTNVTRVEGFNNGIKSYVAQQDNSADGSAKNWQHIESLFDANGQVSSVLTLYDTNVYKAESFENGVKRYSFQEDRSVDGAAAQWQTIETGYDESGNLGARITVYDADVIKVEHFEIGIRTVTSEVDQSADGSARKWQTKDTSYDDAGQMQWRATLTDADVETTEYFENGTRTYTHQHDRSADGLAVHWENKLSEYDENGKLVVQMIDYDNGIAKRVEFNNGVKDNIFEQDNSADGSAANWQYRARDYDGEGAIEFRQTLFDTDVFELVSYENGVRYQNYREDLSTDGSVKNWQSFTTQYDENGIIERSNIVYDDTDIRFSLYEDGNINARLDIDGDESETWAAREVQYDQSGNISDTIFYDSVDDVPIEFFGELFV